MIKDTIVERGCRLWPYFLIGLCGLAVGVFRFGASAFLVSQHETEAKYRGDILQADSGLNYFIQDDWRFPLLKLPNMAFEERGGNAINTDSIPIIAILAKLAYQVHPKLYDYFASWLIFCCVMQGLALAWVVSLRRCLGLLNCLSVCLFGLFSTALLYRWGHIALSSHFLIIFSIGAYLQGRNEWVKGTRTFGILIFLSLCINAYLFALVFGFFAVHLAQGCLDDPKRIRNAVYSMLFAVVGIVVIGVVLGYWEWGRYIVSPSGYGIYSMNVLSPFWPYKSLLFDVPAPFAYGGPGQYEGMNYLGFGLLVLSILVFFKERNSLLKLSRTHLLFVAYMLFLFFFAVSHDVWVGKFNIVTIDLNEHIYHVFSNFRSAGRMFWGVVYSLIVFVIIRTAGYGRNWRLLILGLGIVQLIDLSPYFHLDNPFGKTLEADQAKLNERWKGLMSSHERVYLHPTYGDVFPYERERREYENIVYLASKLNKPISTAYLNRRFTPETGWEITDRVVLTPLDEEAVYILLNPMSIVDATMLAGDFNYIRRSQFGFVISKQFSGSLDSSEADEISKAVERYFVIETKQFDTSQKGSGFKYLWGVNGPNHDGSYLDSTEAGLTIPAFEYDRAESGYYLLRLETDAYCLPSIPERRVVFYCGGKVIGEHRFDLETRFREKVELKIPTELVGGDGELKISWKFDRSDSPSDLGESNDTRRFGLYLRSFSLEQRASMKADFVEMNYEACDNCLGRELLVGDIASEAGGTWMDSAKSGLVLFFPEKPKESISIEIDGLAFGQGKIKERTLQFFANDMIIGEEIFNEVEGFDRLIRIIAPSESISKEGILRLRWSFDTHESPRELGINNDNRRLGLYLRSFSVTSFKNSLH